MSKNRSKTSARRNQQHGIPNNGSLLDHQNHGMKTGIKWARRVSNDRFSYAYFKLRMDETFPNGVNLVDYFTDPYLGSILRREHWNEIDAITIALSQDRKVDSPEILARLKESTVAWLRGWLDGVKVFMENREEAEKILRASNTKA